MVPAPSEKPSTPFAVVFLAAGYGTRLARDLTSDPQFSHLSSIPKPLLPLASAPILSHWLPRLSSLSTLTSITVITNAAHHELYKSWAADQRADPKYPSLPPIRVLSDGTTSNANRLGAVRDLQLALESIDVADAAQPAAASATPAPEYVLVIAADTLLPKVDLPAQLVDFEHHGKPLAVFSYMLSNPADCANRGMLAVSSSVGDGGDEIKHATSLVEKPPTPAEAPSLWATAPIYLLRRSVWPDLSVFLQERADAPLAERDAPGHLLGWLIPRHFCHVLPIPGRIDIGRLAHYRDALHFYTTYAQNDSTDGKARNGAEHNVGSASVAPRRRADEPVVARAHPRAGLAGNPSDMHGGRVVALSLASEGYAEVIASPAPRFSVLPNAALELAQDFDSPATFLDRTSATGTRFGARQLVLAGALVFLRKFAAVRGRSNLAELPGCTMSYNTTIQARVGLSGSSAFVLATWRALSQFFGVTLEQLDPQFDRWPPLLRSAEADELGIACGLMDRVVQLLQGVVSMDFSTDPPGYSRLSTDALPQLFLLSHDGGEAAACSGSVHAGATTAQEKDSSKRDAAIELAELAASADAVLKRREEKGCDVNNDEGCEELADIFTRNFALRLQLRGEEKVGKSNIALVGVAKERGFAAKMSGSGGCALCIARPYRKLSDTQFAEARESFKSHGMELREVAVLPARPWTVDGSTEL